MVFYLDFGKFVEPPEPPTPAPPTLAQALWRNEVVRRCLIEAGDDTSAALAAAEYIVATQQPPAHFSLKDGEAVEKSAPSKPPRARRSAVDARLDRLMRKWTPEQRTAYEMLESGQLDGDAVGQFAALAMLASDCRHRGRLPRLARRGRG